MEKMEMMSKDMIKSNVSIIRQFFPNCVVESENGEGGIEYSVDFHKLKGLLSDSTSEEDLRESYEFKWVGKRKSIREANSRVNKTLRPNIDKSVEWDSTRNLYIEGDNLDTLKLLQESYLEQIKLIYIDPPYNTGSDLIYRDSFVMSQDEYDSEIGVVDSEGNKLFKNTTSNGRFHSEWCSMIYPRLLLARNLLAPDGIICISMDDNEETNLKNICNEIFGPNNRVGEIIRKTKSMTADNGNGFNLQHEILVIYAKDATKVFLHGEEKEFSNYSNPDNDPNGDWCTADPSAKSGGESTSFGIENPYTHRVDYPPVGRYWAFSKSTMESYIASGRIKFKKKYGSKERGFIFKRYKNNMAITTEPVNSLFALDNEYMNQAATIELKKLFEESYFSYPKPVEFIKKLIQYTDADTVMDFFSGSATTAHAVMQLSAEDGKERKFIMVQLPELLDEESPAYKAGYRDLCQIGQERIIRASKKIKMDYPGAQFDGGFRVLELDESNMKDVYYSPADTSQNLIAMLESNIKDDRTDLDLLFGCLLDWGLPLSMPYSSEIIDGCTVHTYNKGDLIACFNENIPESVVKIIAKREPLRVVFRDSSFNGSSAKINVGEIFKLISPETSVKVL